MVFLGILSVKNVTLRLITAKYCLYSGILLLPLLIILRITSVIFTNNSYIYGYLIIIALLVWSWFYLLALILRVQKFLLDSDQLEFVTVKLIYTFNKKKILYNIFFVDPKYYLYTLIIAGFLSFFVENIIFGQIYLWMIFVACYISLIQTRENAIFLIQHFNWKYSIDNSEESDLRVPAVLGEIYRTGNSSNSWSELFQNFFKSSYSLAEDKIPRSLFPKNTPNNVMFGTFCVVSGISVGSGYKAYYEYHKECERTIQIIEKTSQIQKEISAYSEKQLTYRAEEASFKAREASFKAQEASFKAEEASFKAQEASFKAQERVLDKQTTLAKSQDSTIGQEITKAAFEINKKN